MLVIFINMYYTPPIFYTNNLQESSYHVLSSRLENSVDPDQLASEKPAYLDLQGFQNWTDSCLAC